MSTEKKSFFGVMKSYNKNFRVASVMELFERWAWYGLFAVLISLQNFKAENVFLIKKFQSKTTLSDSQIVKFGKYIGKDLKKLS